MNSVEKKMDASTSRRKRNRSAANSTYHENVSYRFSWRILLGREIVSMSPDELSSSNDIIVSHFDSAALADQDRSMPNCGSDPRIALHHVGVVANVAGATVRPTSASVTRNKKTCRWRGLTRKFVRLDPGAFTYQPLVQFLMIFLSNLGHALLVWCLNEN